MLSLSAQKADTDTIVLNQIDGPYILHREKGNIDMVRVSASGLSIDSEVCSSGQSFAVSSQDERYQFEVKLHTVSRPAWNYPQPEKILVLSDPHGNMDAFVSILRSQNIIDDKFNWIFDQGHLVVIGDVFDRGEDVLPIFWLIYKLEDEAAKVGGQVHFLLGNHEEMILRDNVKYAKQKYTNLALKMGIQHSSLWSSDSELGYWLLTRNTIEVIGQNLFVHAGLSKEFSEQRWAIPRLNEAVSTYVNIQREDRQKLEVPKFLFGSNGPLWYRGMVKKTDKDRDMISDIDVSSLLKQYDVNRIYLGHTIFDEVSAFYDDRVIAVNVNNQQNMDNARSRGVLIVGDKTYKVYDDPMKKEFFK